MAASAPPGPPATPPLDPQLRDLLDFIREQNDANRTAVREDADASRALFRHTAQLITLPLSFIIAAAAFFGWRSLDNLKESIQTEARAETKAEITRMQGEIRDTLKEQFQTPALQKMVRDAAAESTRTAAEPLIKSEVANQVKLRVDAERPEIARTVSRETQVAVKEMTPQIQTMVKGSVDEKVQTAVNPVTQRLQTLASEAELEQLISRTDNDDAEAFDQLYSIAVTTTDSKVRDLATNTITSVMAEHVSGIMVIPSFNEKHTLDQAVAELENPDPTARRAALGIVAGTLDLSRLFSIGTMDKSLTVRCHAMQVFLGRVKQNTFQCLNKPAISAWWEAHKTEYANMK